MNAFFAFSKKYMHCISPLATVISSSLYGCFVASVSFKPVLATVWCLSAFVEAQYQLFPWSLCWLQFGFQNPRAFMATFLWSLEFSMLFFFLCNHCDSFLWKPFVAADRTKPCLEMTDPSLMRPCSKCMQGIFPKRTLTAMTLGPTFLSLKPGSLRLTKPNWQGLWLMESDPT